MPFFLGDAFFESTFHETGMTLGPLTRRTSQYVIYFYGAFEMKGLYKQPLTVQELKVSIKN